MAINDITGLRTQTVLGSNRKKRPFAFGLSMPDEEETFDESGKNYTYDARPTTGLKSEDLDTEPTYKRETEATERFIRLLDQFPEREQPGFMDKLAGAAAYLGNKSRGIPGGQEAAENAKYAGYNRDLADWKERTQPTYQAANLERYANATERQAVGQELRDRRAAEGQAITEQKNRDTAENAKRRNDILQSKQDGYTYSTLGNKLIGHRPDGTTFEAGSADDFSPLELERLKQKGRVEIEGVKGTEARKTDAQRAAEALILEAQKDRADLEQAKARSSAGKGDNQDELNKQRSAVIEKLSKDNPEFKKHIRQNTATGNYELRQRPVAGRWPWSDDATAEQAEWDALNEYIYQLVQPTPHLTGGQVGTPPPSIQVPPTQKPPSGGGSMFGGKGGFGGVTEGQPPPPRQFFPTPTPPQQPPQQQMQRPGVPPGEALLRRLSDDSLITARQENVQAMIATGRYELVP